MRSPQTAVTQDRWLEAQRYELRTWQRQNRWYNVALSRLRSALDSRALGVGDDWNMWWYEKFDRYRELPDQIENAVELGCGPYTNIRLVSIGRTIRHLHCSDPLARHYVRFRRRWLGAKHRNGEILLDDHPIEECPFASDYFDLVILVNVLDHVRDAVACLRAAARITKPNGHLVFGQDLTDVVDTQCCPEDVGHPIRMHHEDLDAYLRPRFQGRLRKLLTRAEGRNPQAHYGTYLYIGRKLPNGQSDVNST